MGFGDFFDRPNPIDMQDLIGKLLTDCVGSANNATTEELAQEYLGRTDFEAMSFMEQHLQRARAILYDRGIQLNNLNKSWYIADTAQEAWRYRKKHIDMLTRKYRREVAHLALAGRHFPEITQHPIIQAMGGAERAIEEIEKAKELPL